MKIITTNSVFPYDYPVDKGIERLAAIGFDGVDIAIDYCSMDKNGPFNSDKWQDWAKSLKEKSEELGIELTHSHACGNAAARGEQFLKGIELCGILDIPYTVVHPIHQKADGSFFEDEEEFIKINSEAIKPILEVAEKNNVIVLSENILWGASKIPECISALVSEVNSPYFGWCYDTGHTNCLGIGFDTLKLVKNVPLSLHIQDNTGAYGKDDHMMPGDGNIDWNGFLGVLKEIGYKGEFVLEAHHQSLEAKDCERDGILKEILNRSRKMVDYYNTL